MLIRKRHWLLQLLSLRAVVNGSTLYELREGIPVVIPVNEGSTQLTVTNGFHRSEKIQLPFVPDSTYFFQVHGVVGNTGMAALLAISLLLFAWYAYSGSGFLLVAANLPVLVLIWLFFLWPSRAIVLKSWQPETIHNQSGV
jgi:hypothetical protein